MIKLKGYNGFLFVGDPHLWSKKPGKRLDSNFTEVILDKIDQSIKIAKKENLYLIFLGDLFDKDDECDIGMLTKLTRILKQHNEAYATVEGNHERKQVSISDEVALALMSEAGTIHVMKQNGWWGSIQIGDKYVLIGSTPNSSKIPREVTLPKAFEDKDVFTIWLTHHNLAFGDTYPGVEEIHEIKGVDILINGHIHQTKKPVIKGMMKAFNPGNITRVSKDCADHIPAVWKWVPEQGREIEPIPLVYKKSVFMLENQIKTEVEVPVVSIDMTPQQKLLFVEGLEEQLNQDHVKTDDGEEVKIQINAMAKALNSVDEIRNNILELAEEALKMDSN